MLRVIQIQTLWTTLMKKHQQAVTNPQTPTTNPIAPRVPVTELLIATANHSVPRVRAHFSTNNRYLRTEIIQIR